MSDYKIKLNTAKSRRRNFLDKSSEVQKGKLDNRDPSDGPRPKNRKIILPKKSESLDITSEAMVIPALDGLLNDSLTIIGNELTRYRAKTARGVSLELKEARAVQGYMDTLVKLSKESREQSRYEDFSNLSDQELLELASEHLKGIEHDQDVKDKEDDREDSE